MVDPMCGSATILLEAAQMAHNRCVCVLCAQFKVSPKKTHYLQAFPSLFTTLHRAVNALQSSWSVQGCEVLAVPFMA